MRVLTMDARRVRNVVQCSVIGPLLSDLVVGCMDARCTSEVKQKPVVGVGVRDVHETDQEPDGVDVLDVSEMDQKPSGIDVLVVSVSERKPVQMISLQLLGCFRLTCLSESLLLLLLLLMG